MRKMIVFTLFLIFFGSLAKGQSTKEKARSYCREGNYSAAKLLYIQCIENGDPECTIEYAQLLLNGDLLEETHDQIYSLLEPLANRGNGTAQYLLGKLYFDGRGIPQDYYKAFDWFDKLLKNSNTTADVSSKVVNYYDKYLVAMNGNVSDAFYYYREQAKFRTGELQGALQDIDMAILLNKDNALYYVEKASVHLRLNEFAKAQENVEKAIRMDSEFASAYRILGVCLVRQDKKTKACTHFAKAKELGDPVAEKLIKEHCNE